MFRIMTGDALKGRTLVFVIGVFRSGTSLLHRLLHAHPQVSLMWEADALRFLAAKAHPHWWRRLDEWNGCISRHGIDGERLPPQACREEAALALYLAMAMNDPDVRVIGEKSPYYCDVIRRLARDFPLARFVLIHRDPAAVEASVRNAAEGNRFFSRPFMPFRVLKDAGRLKRDARWLAGRGHFVHEIEFGDLVSDAAVTMNALFQALGLDPIPLEVGAREELRGMIPAGGHHHKVLGAGVEAERAVPVQCGATIMLHQAFRAWLHDGAVGDWRLAGHIPALLAGEASYQSLRAVECGKRMAFRNLPLNWLRHHREAGGHVVK
jgi:hypothetical protein